MHSQNRNRQYIAVVALCGVAAAIGVGAALRATADARQPITPASVELLRQTSDVFGVIAEKVSPAVVYIEARRIDKSGHVRSEESGSGVLLRVPGSEQPAVVTNLHVVDGSAPHQIEVYLADGRLLEPRGILTDSQTDLAVLEVAETDLPTARMGDSDKARVGAWVLAIGSPFGLSQSVSHGIISARQRRHLGMPGEHRVKEFLQTDAAINPGSSGGPLVDLDGTVIGITTAIASRTGSHSGVGFAIPINLVRWVAGELVAHGKVRRGFLGVEFPHRYDREQARKLGLQNARGALVERVHPNTPAERAGLRAGDVILRFDGVTVADDNHLINAVSQTPIGKTVEVTVWRSERPRRLVVTLGSWDEFRPGIEPANADAPAETRPAPQPNDSTRGS